MFKKLAGCIRSYKKYTILTPILMVGEVAMECLIPFITAALVNKVKAGCDFKEILSYGILLVLMACISLFFGAMAGRTGSIASCGFGTNLRHDMYEKIQTFSFENIDKFSSSSIITRLTTDSSNVQMAFMMIIRMAVRSPLMFIFAIIMAFVMGGKLAFMFAIVIPFLAFGLIIIVKNAMPTFRKVFKKYDVLNESIQENIAGMRVVKSFVREDYEKKKFGRASDDVRRDFTKAERIVALNSPLMQLCLYANMIIILFFGSKTVVTSQGATIDVGQLSSMITYGFMILSSLMMISVFFVMMTLAGESAKRICEILDEVPTLKQKENAIKTVRDGSVDFDGVCFKYSARASKNGLENINLHIKSGEVIGIIGGIGSAKSSLIQLIPRLYDVNEGCVKVGGVDVRDYDIEVLRDNVAVVLQKNVLFSGTIKENMRWGDKNATNEDIVKACKLAQADDFIKAFPDGYDTYIEQGGTNVSGGQKQRLCIARALLKKPKILILDDSTSAVDTKTDAMIRKSMREFIPETTKIIIAQRIASVQDADRIVVLDCGKIDAVGTHEELLANNRIYQEVYYSQNKGGNDDE